MVSDESCMLLKYSTQEVSILQAKLWVFFNVWQENHWKDSRAFFQSDYSARGMRNSCLVLL
jgi:hypothetical protein